MSDEVHLRIKMARIGAKMSQQDLARTLSSAIGKPYSRTLVAAIESGSRSPTLEELRAIADWTLVPLSWLIGGFAE